MSSQQRRISLNWLSFLACSILLFVGYAFQGWSNSTPRIVTSSSSGHVSMLKDVKQFLAHTDGEQISNVMKRDDYSCSAENPCSNGACCGGGSSPLFCGYGDTYCGSTCVSQCNATAECGENAAVPGTKCPLNVCCSQYGFCGTTTDFCDVATCQSNCGQPSVPAGGSTTDVRDNVIGYYESWSSARTCHSFSPQAIPVNGLQRVNFAFAYIDPSSLEITTMDSSTSTDLFKQVADVKSSSSANNGLEVFVSIGGWTFNDNDTDTQPIFSAIASDATKRSKFASNVLSFLISYGFDGVDLDWEYPGAPDRGGSSSDTDNYPLLMKELRETFDADPKGNKFGITFTVPSSYWYLRWFDLPAMLPYITSINMMTYDLHGVWDKYNPIGNIVQAHTNLTEIKLAMDLLWRNDIPPAMVVLGLGFYGRAFQLQDTSCTVTGCPFSGASAAGPCTGQGGILGYFEIMDILSDKTQEINVVYDEVAAVNYFTYDKDQWVSYDNATTFTQKAEWANTVGLGGLMIWAVDMDDNDFSALSGLLGRENLGTIAAAEEDQTKVDTANWASQNGQQCYEGTCGGGCILGKEVEISRANSCDGGKPICCPIDAAPSSCTWRGGESGRTCHGTCHTDEVTLFYDNYGKDGPKCYSPGQKVFCCQTTTYTDIVNSCHYAGCGKDCDSGYYNPEGVYKYDPQVCAYDYGGSGPQDRKMCCPTSPQILNCHWVGKGGCDQNNCDDNDMQLDLDSYGDSKHLCTLPGRSKSLCCDSPVSSNPFLPVELSNVFPTLPTSADVPEWDIQTLGLPAGTGSGFGGTNDQGFGFVLIDGPSSVVSSVSKRDGSDYEFLECPSGTDRQSVRIFCNSYNQISNCHDIYEGGIDGTVIKLPENCGPGTYVVAHDLSESKFQGLPSRFANALNQTVLDLELSYDFGLVKRDSGDVYIRIDYSNLPGYWDAVVDSAGESKKRSVMDKRFFSSSDASWKSKFDTVRSATANSLDYTMFSKTFSTALVDDSVTCTGGDDNYAAIGISGSVYAKARFGYSFVGTVSPFNIVQAYGFSESDIGMTAALDVQMNGALNLPDTQANVFATPITLKEFSVPGLVHFKPSLQLVATLTANMAMSADFTVLLNTSTTSPDGSAGIIQYYPSTTGKSSGGSHMAASISGDGITDSTSGSLRFGFMPMMNMDITIDSYSSGTVEMHETISAYHDAYVGISSDGECPEIQAGISKVQIALSSVAGSFSPWSADESTTKLLDGTTGSSTLSGVCSRSSSTTQLAKRDFPSGVAKYSAPYVFGNYYVVKCATGLSSSSNETGLLPGDDGFCSTAPLAWPLSGLYDADGTELESNNDDIIDDDGEDDADDDDLNSTLEKRGALRSFYLAGKKSGSIFAGVKGLISVPYPDKTELIASTPNIAVWARDTSQAAGNCGLLVITNKATSGANTIVEHMFEQGILIKLARASIGVVKTLPSGATSVLSYVDSKVWTDMMVDQVVSPVTGLTGTVSTHMYNIVGSYVLPAGLFLLDGPLNGLKASMHNPKVKNIVGVDKWVDFTISEKLSQIQDILAVYKYMSANSAVLITIVNQIRQELASYAVNKVGAENLVDWFDTFMIDFGRNMDQRVLTFVAAKTVEIANTAKSDPKLAAAGIVQIADLLKQNAPDIVSSPWFTKGISGST